MDNKEQSQLLESMAVMAMAKEINDMTEPLMAMGRTDEATLLKAICAFVMTNEITKCGADKKGDLKEIADKGMAFIKQTVDSLDASGLAQAVKKQVDLHRAEQQQKGTGKKMKW